MISFCRFWQALRPAADDKLLQILGTKTGPLEAGPG
jgi:hypothetical protein